MGNSPPQLRRRRPEQQQPQEVAAEDDTRPTTAPLGDSRENEPRNHVTYHVIVDRGTNQTVIHQEATPINQVLNENASEDDDYESISEMMAIRIFSRLLGATRMRR